MANVYEYVYDKYGADASTAIQYTKMFDITIPNKHHSWMRSKSNTVIRNDCQTFYNLSNTIHFR
jgi:hypothetical protein